LPIGKAAISGSPYLGVYLKVNENRAVAPPSIPVSLERVLERVLGVQVLKTTVGDSEIVGALVTMNSHGVVVSTQVDEKEISVLKTIGPVYVLHSHLNALGNTILANDHGAIVHPDFSRHEMDEISRVLGVKVVPSTVAGEGTVSKTAVATNKGAVVHPGTTEREIRVLEETLGVKVHKTTANFGVPLVGACVIANSRGMLVGVPTTPVELVHLEEGLAIYD
jgi:translation initiation factor 6